ncbi:UNKNOWN [Stylonychia lemnae]|uniref:Uncharacterized protein n=1 Tax=Stylonychia lemnae TaxID=5949 RepID=A0A077ZPA5_STYLE|nr:UNKNOWN [Stylonychia lemnae]|eukprot:CDW71289.1 UNKNOWN [Stylonychia lemnae]
MRLQTEEYQKAIDSYLVTTNEDVDNLMQINSYSISSVRVSDMIVKNRKDAKNNQKIFLNKEQLVQMKDQFNKNQELMCQVIKGRKLWKPDQLKISRQMRGKFQFLLRSDQQYLAD